MPDVREKLVELIHDARMNALWHNAPKPDEYIAEMIIANGVTIQRWIPVTERLPENDGKYIVARRIGDYYSISVRKFRKEVPCWYTGYCGHWERRTCGITHWMPLPEAPKEDE